MIKNNSLILSKISIILVFSLFACEKSPGEFFDLADGKDLMKDIKLTQEAASNFASLTLDCIQREYPNKLSHVMNNEKEVESPKALHPAFYGCFDWHSAVHGHWMLVRLLKLFPGLPEAAEIRKTINQNLTAENILKEVEYLFQPSRKSFERTYGWAWLLKLAEELNGWDNIDGNLWSKNLQPLADVLVKRYFDFLPRQTYPIRRGVHANTAFGIAFAIDYARLFGDKKLDSLLVERSVFYFAEDKDCPVAWEPSGDDFFSPCLMEADLMRRVLPSGEFKVWFHKFLPDLVVGEPASLLKPATVADRSDPKIVHLDGLNLSRAWCLLGIASALDKKDPVRNLLIESAVLHAKETLKHIASGNYEGEHWLASFAVYLLSELNNF